MATTAKGVAAIGPTLKAVITVPQALAVAGQATWIADACALIAIALVSETLVSYLDGVTTRVVSQGVYAHSSEA